jgi:hypothetical protein
MAWTKTNVAAVTGVSLLLAGGLTFVVLKKARHAPQSNPRVEMKEHVRPRERREEAERIKKRQARDQTTGATAIDLRPYINAKLTEAPSCWKDNNENNLSELPAGKHIYAGVPFDVQGSIQLMGGWLKHYDKTYPLQVTNISVGRKCEKLHLLHGNSFVIHTNFGTVVSKLVLHYADSTTRQIDIVAGQQAFDFWCPLFKSGVPPQYLLTASGTERAWTGSNPYIRRWQPELSLVLYKSTLYNPQPELGLSSVDFVSTGTITCPFLVGLTVE